ADSIPQCGDFAAVGLPHHSGNFALLPFLEQKALYDQANISQSLDGGALNRSLLRGQFLSAFTCPSSPLKRKGVRIDGAPFNGFDGPVQEGMYSFCGGTMNNTMVNTRDCTKAANSFCLNADGGVNGGWTCVHTNPL